MSDIILQVQMKPKGQFVAIVVDVYSPNDDADVAKKIYFNPNSQLILQI